MPLPNVPHLCGGIFFDLLLEARRFRTSQRDTFNSKADGLSERECKIVCVNRYCMNLLYAPYWGKQR